MLDFLEADLLCALPQHGLAERGQVLQPRGQGDEAVGGGVGSAVPITAGTRGSKDGPGRAGGCNGGRGNRNLSLCGPQRWARPGTGRGDPSPCSKAPPNSAIGGDTIARSRGNASGISWRMKASSFSLISQRRSQDCGADRALTSARSSIARGLASITWRLTTAPSHNLDSRTASSNRCLIRETS